MYFKPKERFKQSFPIRDKKVYLGQGRATSSKGVDDLSGSRVAQGCLSGPGKCSGSRKTLKGIPGATESDKTPLGYVDGLNVRISLLETAIHDLSEKGDSEELRRALKEYALTWIELKRGFLCK